MSLLHHHSRVMIGCNLLHVFSLSRRVCCVFVMGGHRQFSSSMYQRSQFGASVLSGAREVHIFMMIKRMNLIALSHCHECRVAIVAPRRLMSRLSISILITPCGILDTSFCGAASQPCWSVFFCHVLGAACCCLSSHLSYVDE